VVREGVGAGEEMTQALYAHMNKKKKKQQKKTLLFILSFPFFSTQSILFKSKQIFTTSFLPVSLVMPNPYAQAMIHLSTIAGCSYFKMNF
jgi:hypothetical protein